MARGHLTLPDGTRSTCDYEPSDIAAGDGDLRVPEGVFRPHRTLDVATLELEDGSSISLNVEFDAGSSARFAVRG